MVDKCYEKAIDKVLTKEMGYRKAASAYAVPHTASERYVKRMREGCGLPYAIKNFIHNKRRRNGSISEIYGRTSFWTNNV